MLNKEQLEYINSLKKTHPNVDKETLRKAMLESEWSEIEIMEAISLYNSNSKKTIRSEDKDNEDRGKNSDKLDVKESSFTRPDDDEEVETDDDHHDKDDKVAKKTKKTKGSDKDAIVKEKTFKNKIISLATNILIVVLFLILIVVAGLVFFQVSLDEVKEFINSDILESISDRIESWRS